MARYTHRNTHTSTPGTGNKQHGPGARALVTADTLAQYEASEAWLDEPFGGDPAYQPTTAPDAPWLADAADLAVMAQVMADDDARYQGTTAPEAKG